MSYTKQTWSDTASSGTPITATRMNHMEDGIKAANDAWDSVSRVEFIADTNGFYAYARAGIVTVGLDYFKATVAAWESATMWTLPVGYRPPRLMLGAVETNGSASGVKLHVWPDGTVAMSAQATGLTNEATWGSVTFPVA